MSAQQRQLYAKTDRLFRSNSTTAGDSSDNFMSMFMQLRKMACHPLLLRHLYTDELLAKMAQDIMKEECYHDANQQYILEVVCCDACERTGCIRVYIARY